MANNSDYPFGECAAKGCSQPAMKGMLMCNYHGARGSHLAVNKTPIYAEDLIAILKNRSTFAVAGHMGAASRVVDHQGLLSLLENMVAARSPSPENK